MQHRGSFSGLFGVPSRAGRMGVWLLLLLGIVSGRGFAADDMVQPGELIIERATLNALGFEWRIEGDANGDSSCMVEYRNAGAAEWREYLPFFRLGRGARVWFATFCGWPHYAIPDALAGSIMDLEPGTEYEVRLTLTDPDGVEGEAEKLLTLKTRAEPKVPEGGEVRHVYPTDWQGKKEQNAFRNIMHALNGYAPMCDQYQTIHPNVAKPGTVVKMHGGVHTTENHTYFKNGQPYHSYWLHGAITIMARGTPDQPICIVPAGDGEVIIDGDGCHNLFNLRSAEYLHFEGLTIRNTEIAFHCGWQGLKGGGMPGLTVKNCWIEGVVYGVLAQDGASIDFNILDNVFIGCNPHFVHQKWKTTAGYAVNLGGQGHSVKHNYAANFWDGINVFCSALADPAYKQQARAIDITDNEVNYIVDTAIEAESGYANIRVLRNRLNSSNMSVQMVYAGPVYFIRNIVWYEVPWRNRPVGSPFKDHLGAQAFVALHNTSSTGLHLPPNTWWTPEQCTWLVQNNLCLNPGDKEEALVKYPPGAESPQHVIDCNAYSKEAAGSPCVVTGNGKKGIQGKTFTGFEEMRRATGYEENSLLVDGDSVLVDAPSDLRPREGTPIVDAGARLPGINDGFSGKGPDIGAFEAGQPLPICGPRSGSYLERLEKMRKGEYVPKYESAASQEE